MLKKIHNQFPKICHSSASNKNDEVRVDANVETSLVRQTTGLVQEMLSVGGGIQRNQNPKSSVRVSSLWMSKWFWIDQQLLD